MSSRRLRRVRVFRGGGQGDQAQACRRCIRRPGLSPAAREAVCGVGGRAAPRRSLRDGSLPRSGSTGRVSHVRYGVLCCSLRALQLVECTAGLVVGVSLVLAPGVGTSFALAGMTSARGRLHMFQACLTLVRGRVCARRGVRRGDRAVSPRSIKHTNNTSCMCECVFANDVAALHYVM